MKLFRVALKGFRILCFCVAPATFVTLILSSCFPFYWRSTIDPPSIKIVSDFEETSLHCIGPPLCIVVQLKDSKKDVFNALPDLSTASLTSSKGVRYPLRFLPDRMSYDGASGGNVRERERSGNTQVLWIGYPFDIMSRGDTNAQLNNIPDGRYTLSALFIGPSGTNSFSASFMRRTRLERIQIWDH